MHCERLGDHWGGFGNIEGNPHDNTLQFAVSTSYHLCSMFLLSFRAIGVGGEGTLSSD